MNLGEAKTAITFMFMHPGIITTKHEFSGAEFRRKDYALYFGEKYPWSCLNAHPVRPGKAAQAEH